MKHPDVQDSDHFDAIIERTLKNWLSLYRRPGEMEKARLLRAVAAIDKVAKGPLGVLPLVITSIRWLVDNLFFSSVDQPIIYSISTGRSFSKSNNVTLLMAERGVMESLPIQMGVASLTT
jgi:hypothetical protein